MRIVGGTLKGRKFSPPLSKWPTRPTTDFAREALFNILHNSIDFDDIVALELFGGTGAHSFEMVSRGVEKVVYVDKYYGCYQFVKQLTKKLNLDSKIEVIKSDVLKYIASCGLAFDYIFADPPFDFIKMKEIPDLVFGSDILNKEGLFVLEHGVNDDFSSHPNFQKTKKYGTVNFSFFEHI